MKTGQTWVLINNVGGTIRAGRLRTFPADLRTSGLPEAKFGRAVRTAIMG